MRVYPVAVRHASATYTLRVAGTTDLDRIQAMWQHLAPNWGFGPKIVSWYGSNPSGPNLVVLAELEDGTLAGHMAFRPGFLRTGTRDVLTARAEAVIISPALRTWEAPDGRPVNPVFDMYDLACDELSTRGYGCVYMIPDPRWVRLLQMMPHLITGSFPLHSLKLPLDQPFDLGAGMRVGPVTSWDTRIDRLFHATASRFGCIIRRDAAMLSWLVGPGNGAYDVLGVEREGELIGVVASQERGDFQWLIADMLTADGGPALEATIKAAANHAHGRVGDPTTRKPIRKVALLQPPAFAPITASLGFTRDQYDFPVVVTRLDSSIPVADLAPAHWYLSATE